MDLEVLRWQELNKRQHDIHLRALKKLGFFFPAGLESISKNVNLFLEVKSSKVRHGSRHVREDD